MRTAAVIPAFNSDKTIREVVKETLKHVDTVIVVDDGSTDKTSSILKRLAKRGHCTVLTHQKNSGKGEALRTAIKYLKSRSKSSTPDAVIFLDADGEHNPGNIPRFLAMLKEVDVVLGARTSHRNRARRIMNKWMGFWFRLVDSGISDPSCGFRAVRWDVLRKLELHSSDFCIDAEIMLGAIKAGASITSIPLSHCIYSKSSVSRADFLRINNFFDTWVLQNVRHMALSPARRTMLVAGASAGRLLGTLLAKRIKDRK